MAKLSVSINSLDEQVSALRGIGKTLASFEGRLQSISNAMDGRDSTMASLKTLVKSCGNTMPQLTNRASTSSAVLSDCKLAYKKAEADAYAAVNGGYNVEIFGHSVSVNEDIFRLFPDLFIGNVSALSALSVLTKGGAWSSILGQILPKTLNDLDISVGRGLEKGGFEELFGWDIDELEEKLGKKEKTKELRGKVPDIDKLATIIGVEASKEASILSFGSGKKEFDYGYGEVSADVGVAEAHAGLSLGVYSLDENGNKRFAPGVSAEIGASVCALSVAASGVLGSDNLGLYGKGSLDVAKAGAGGELDVGFFDKNGKLDIAAKASLSAEAVLVEAKGSAGATVLGAEVGVSGSVKVGVGANFDVGFKDGKLSCKVGASLGIGFDVGFDIDVGGLAKGTVNAVSNAATSVWNGFKGLFS